MRRDHYVYVDSERSIRGAALWEWQIVRLTDRRDERVERILRFAQRVNEVTYFPEQVFFPVSRPPGQGRLRGTLPPQQVHDSNTSWQNSAGST